MIKDEISSHVMLRRVKLLGGVGGAAPPNDYKRGFFGNFLAPRILVGQSLTVSFMQLFYCCFLYQLSIIYSMEIGQKQGLYCFLPQR